MAEIIDPFKQNKKTNWAKKVENKLNFNNENKKLNESNINKEKKEEEKEKKKIRKNKIERVAKSFKIYPGKISRTFDKRVNKLQVYFDDLDYDKNYVDSGKYIMFLMQFAEKFRLYELYKEVNDNGEFDLDIKDIKEFIKKL